MVVDINTLKLILKIIMHCCLVHVDKEKRKVGTRTISKRVSGARI